MRLSKPIEKYTQQEVENICSAVRSMCGRSIKADECDLDWITCHFKGTKFCRSKRHD